MTPTIMLVLSGVVVSSIFNAGVSTMKYLADPESDLPAITFWLTGSLSGMRWDNLAFAAPIILAGLVVVMMDEPTSHLDYRNATTVISTAHTLAHEQGKAVVMITHMPDQAFHYPSRTALMKDGRFFASGPSEAVLTRENLSEVYDMDMLVLTASDDDGHEYLTCRPALAAPGKT